MAKNVGNKASQLCGWGNTSNNATFRVKSLKSNLMFLLSRIKTFCHPELVSGSHVFTGKTLRFRNKFGMTSFKKALAFTLAETLIVMGIIGVVAALTIPNLNSSTGEKEKVAKVKKVYSNLVDAYGRMEAVYGPFIDTINNQDLGSKPAELAQTLGDRLTEFMKTSKNCERKSNNGCFTNKIYDLDGSVDSAAINDSTTTTYKFILADGTAVAISLVYGGIVILFDIDGPQKGLSTFGKDLFFVTLEFEGSDLSELSAGDETNDCFSSGFCTYWVLQNDNMDYLKADRTGNCPNGKVLNFTTNTSCK